MRKRLILLLTFVLPSVLMGQTYKLTLYPSIGADVGGAVPFPLSDIPAGAKWTPSVNPSLGAGLKFTLNDRWDLIVEANYHNLEFTAEADVRSQPYFYGDQQYVIYFSGHTETDVEIKFLEIPLMAGYSISNNWILTPGLYYSKIFKSDFSTSGQDGVTSTDKAITDNAVLPGPSNPNYDFDDYMDTWDVGVLLGFRYSLNHRLSFTTRLQTGFKSIFKADFDSIDYEMYQVRLSVGVAINLINLWQK